MIWGALLWDCCHKPFNDPTKNTEQDGSTAVLTAPAGNSFCCKSLYKSGKNTWSYIHACNHDYQMICIDIQVACFWTDLTISRWICLWFSFWNCAKIPHLRAKNPAVASFAFTPQTKHCDRKRAENTLFGRSTFPGLQRSCERRQNRCFGAAALKEPGVKTWKSSCSCSLKWVGTIPMF